MENFIFGIIVYLILIFLIFYKASTKVNNDDYISKNVSKCLKGYSIIIILLCHFIQRIDIPRIVMPFSKIGYLGVSVFLFLSGYGVAKSFQKTRLKKFWSKRIRKVYIPFIISNVITMLIFYCFKGDIYNFIDIPQYILGIKLINRVLWYVITIFIFYGCFYLLFKDLNVNSAIKLLFCISLIYPIICYTLNLESEWYTTSLNFFIGILMVFYKSKVDNLVNEFYKQCTIISTIMFSFSILSNLYFYDIYYIRIISCYLSSIFFIITVILILYKFKFNNVVVGLLGSLSYEMYLIHMTVYELIFTKYTYNNYIVMYIITVVFFAIIFKKSYNYIFTKLERFIKEL